MEKLKKKYHPKNIDHIDIENFLIPSASVNQVKNMINSCQIKNKLIEDKKIWKANIIKNSENWKGSPHHTKKALEMTL